MKTRILNFITACRRELLYAELVASGGWSDEAATELANQVFSLNGD
jgi:hypothetical protein